jgi:WD40 repeat protein
MSRGKEILSCKGHTGEVKGVAFSRDGKWLVSGGADRRVRVWEASTGRELFSFKGHDDGVTSVAFRPDGKCLATASLDHTVKVWDTVSEPGFSTLRGHSRAWPGHRPRWKRRRAESNCSWPSKRRRRVAGSGSGQDKGRQGAGDTGLWPRRKPMSSCLSLPRRRTPATCATSGRWSVWKGFDRWQRRPCGPSSTARS